MTEEVTKYVVSVGFDDALKNVNKFITKMSKMEQGRESALSRQIKLQKQLNSLRNAGGRGGGGTTTAPPKSPSTNPPSSNKPPSTRASPLEKQLINARRVVNVMNLEEDAATRVHAEAIKTKIATAKTADEVRDIVAMERKRLQLSKRNTKQAERQNFLLRRMRSSSEQVAGNMASAFAIGAGGAFITRTGQDFESVNNTMLAVSENSKEAGENFEFVKNEAFRLGMGLTQSAKGFAKLRAAQGEMSLDDTKTAFSGVSEMSSLLGLTAEESSRTINALGQMMSKGSVSAEELKLQMGR